MPDDDDRVRRSRRAERGGNDNTAVIRRRRRLPSERAGQRFGSVHLSDVSGTEGGGGTTTFFNFGFPSTEIKTEFLLCSRSLNTVCYFLSFCLSLANAVDEPTAGQGQEKKSGGHRVPGAVPNPGRNDDDDDDDDDRGARRGQEKF